MPDRTDELVRELFADLRADELPGVRPPGVQAARRTVRRRRTAVSAGVTCLTVVAIAGLALATARPAPGGGEAAAEQPSRGSLAAADLQQLAYRADAALAERGRGGPPVNDDPHLVMQRSTVLDSGTPAPQSHRLQAGEYHADLRCAGTGRVGFTFRWSPERADRTVDRSRSVIVGTGQAMCYETPTAYSQPFTLAGTGRLEVVLSPDDEAVGHAGFAYQVIRFVEASDESAGNAIAAAHDLRAGRPGSEPVSMRTLHDHLGNNGGPSPRSTTMPVVCRGPGTIRVEVFPGQVDDRGRVTERGAPLADEEVACRSTPQIVTLTLGSPAKDSLVISVKPDGAARNRAGFAYLWPE